MTTLFADAEFEAPARVRAQRPKVEVPAAVVKLLNEAAASEANVITWPVKDADHYNAMADVLYSAGDLLPNNSLTIRPIIRMAGQADVARGVDPAQATHVKVTVGAKRGRRAAE